jgi:hypothetical protein
MIISKNEAWKNEMISIVFFFKGCEVVREVMAELMGYGGGGGGGSGDGGRKEARDGKVRYIYLIFHVFIDSHLIMAHKSALSMKFVIHGKGFRDWAAF